MNYILGSPYKMNGPTICAGGTQYSTVAHLRNWLPVEIGAIMWVAQYRPDVQAYTPYYSSMQSVPELYGYGDYKIAIGHQYNPPKKIYDRSKEHSFWAFSDLVKKIDKDYTNLAPIYQKEWFSVEKKFFKNQEKFEAKVLKVYDKDPLKAKEMLTEYSSKHAMDVYKKAKKMLK